MSDLKHVPGEALLVGWLLSLANSNPPCFSTEFYELKTRLCMEYGRRDGHDWQHIRKECWTCEGTGKYLGLYRCNKCWGSGIYSERWHKLERWVIGKHTFHRPTDRVYSAPDEPVTIEGRIKKDGDFHSSGEACLWLYLIFAPALWLRSLSSSCSAYPGRWPMLSLQWFVFHLVGFTNMFRVRVCMSCMKKFVRPSRRHLHFQCARCEQRAEERHAQWLLSTGKDIPF